MQITIKQVASDFPGLMRRYFPQEVENSPYIPICVEVDGQCNHADTDTEDVYRGYGDPAETVKAEVCVKCEEVVED